MKDNISITQGRRAREREAHRQNILEAAERIFAVKGYESATVEEIAREAEFAAGTLYNFFDNKEALFMAVADRILDDMIARFESEVEPYKNQPQKAIAQYVELRLQMVYKHEAFLHVFQPLIKARCAALRKSGKAGELPPSKFQNYKERMLDVLNDGIRRRLLHDVPAEHLWGVIEGAIRYFVMEWKRSRDAPPAPAEQKLIMERSLLPLLWAHD